MSDLRAMLDEAAGKLTREERIAAQIEKAKRLLPYDWRALVGDLEYLLAQLTEARAVLREVTWLGAHQVPGICFHPADAFRWVFCVSCKTWTRADQPNDPTKLHTPDCRLAKALEGT